MRRKRYASKAALFGGATKNIPLTEFDRFLDYLIDEQGSDTSAKSLYKTVAWVFWCVNQRAGNIAQIPYLILPMEDEEDDPERAVEWGIDLRPTLWEVEAWLRLHGAAYSLKRLPEKLQMLNGYSMRVKEYDDDGPTVFEQKAHGRTKLYSADELLYFRLWNPTDDINEGTSSGQVGKTSAGLVRSSGQWGEAFFRNGAIPAVLLTTDAEVVPPQERERIKGAWNEMLQGVRNAFRTMVLSHGLKPTIISQPVKDLAMPELEKVQKEQILAAYGIPPGLAEAKTNRAERDALQYEFWTQYVKPDVETYIEPVFNEGIFNPLGLRLSFQYNEIEAIQREEVAKAEAMSFVISGVILPAYKENTVNVDEVRRWIDSVGHAAGLPPLDESFEPEERTPPQLQPFTGQEQESDAIEGGPTPADERIESRVSKSLLDDLDKWERKAITRIQEGYPLKALEFASDTIPVVMHRMIVYAIETARSIGDVQEAFERARGEKQIQFIPEGQGDPLPPVPGEVNISDADKDRAIRAWNRLMPDYRGLLDADVTRRENY